MGRRVTTAASLDLPRNVLAVPVARPTGAGCRRPLVDADHLGDLTTRD